MKKTIGIGNSEIGTIYTGFVIVKSMEKGIARNDKEFLKVTLSDVTGQVTAMVWDSNEEKEALFAISNILKIRGSITDYQGNRQFSISQARHIKEDDDVVMSDIVESAPLDGETIIPLIYKTIDDIQNDKIHSITGTIFRKYENEFKEFPAAKNIHHAYVGGLAYHTFCMLNLAKEIAKLYPILNKDLLFAGVILHDIMKVRDYKFNGMTVSDMTLEGKLLGHIPMMIEEIGLTAKNLQIEGEEVVLLQHIIGSHHGLHSNGWGSAVSPMLPEAEALHMIDNMDAKMEILRKGLENVDKGEYSERLFAMDNRSFYKHKL